MIIKGLGSLRAMGTVGFIFLMALSGFALDPAKAITQYDHDIWRQEDGLNQGSVYAIIQTHEGYLWLGTKGGGVARFDGIRFEEFSKKKSGLLPNDAVRAICLDSRGRLWIGTDGGLTVMDPLDNSASTFTRKHGLCHNIVQTIHQDRAGNIWVGTEGGLNRIALDKDFDDVTAAAITRHIDLSGITVMSILEDSSGSLWVGTHWGLFLLTTRSDKGSFAVTRHPVPDALARHTVASLYEDAERNLWIGTWGGGLSCLHPGEKKLTTYTVRDGLSNNNIRSICQDRDGNLWIGTDGGGLNRLRDGKFSIYSSNSGLTNNAVRAIYEDREGSLWIGTRGGGLNRLKDETFTTYTTNEGLSTDYITAILEDRQGRIWIGTYNGGLNGLSPVTGEISIDTTKNGLSNNMIRTLCEDRHGNLWIGTWGGGLSRLTNGRFTTFGAAAGLSGSIVNDICEDHQGDLWVGTNGGGLNRLSKGKFTIYTRETTGGGLADNRIRTLKEDLRRNLWIGTDSGGLSRLKDGSFTVFNTTDGLANNMIRSLQTDQSGSLWIGTNGGGLSRLKNGRFTTITSQNGLYDDTVHRILDDGHGNFWMTSNRGVFVVSINELALFCDGKRQTVNCTAYNESDGMKDSECNSFAQPAGWKSQDGRLWFPTMKGVAVANPGKIKKNRLAPSVVIERMMVQGTGQDPLSLNADVPEGPMVLPPGSRLEIHYTALSFLAPKKVRFKYHMTGFDDRWFDVGTRRTAYFNNLPPGDYTFRVIASNNDGVWNETGASISFIQKPYFHQTLWFYLLGFMVVVLTGFTLYRARVRHLRKRKHELEHLVNQRTTELSTTNERLRQTNIELETIMEELREVNLIALKEREAAHRANRFKSEFLANMSHEIRTPMNAILGFSTLLETTVINEKQKRHLHAITSSGRSLLRLINDILDLSRIEAGSMELQYESVDPRTIIKEIEHIFALKAIEKDIDLQVEIDPELPRGLLLDGLRIRQVLLNLVGNAIKFTEKGFVKLTAKNAGSSGDPKTSTIIFHVQDSGIGIPPDQQDIIFEAFKQKEGQRLDKYGGTGLGLAICQQLILLMGGELSVQSDVGNGSIFQVRLHNIETSAAVTGEETDIKLDVEDVRFEKALVLVADDMELNRQLLMEYLAQSPIYFIEAENGKKAVEKTKKFRPDLILMDIKMPVMNGIEACKAINADRELKDIPVIIITASVMKDQREEIYNECCGGFLNKPVGKSDLIIEMMNFLPYTAIDTREPPSATITGKPEKPDGPPLSPEQKEKLPELLAILKGMELSRNRETIRKTLVIDEIEGFAEKMKQLDDTYHTGLLSRWAAQLYNDLQTFNVPRIQQTLSVFPEVVKGISALAGGVR